MAKSIGLAEYRLTESLPEDLKIALPAIEELEAKLAKDLKRRMKMVYDVNGNKKQAIYVPI